MTDLGLTVNPLRMQAMKFRRISSTAASDTLYLSNCFLPVNLCPCSKFLVSANGRNFQRCKTVCKSIGLMDGQIASFFNPYNRLYFVRSQASSDHDIQDTDYLGRPNSGKGRTIWCSSSHLKTSVLEKKALELHIMTRKYTRLATAVERSVCRF